MTTSESKGRFFLNESICITNRIDSNRDLECSTEGSNDKDESSGVTMSRRWRSVGRVDNVLRGAALFDICTQQSHIVVLVMTRSQHIN